MIFSLPQGPHWKKQHVCHNWESFEFRAWGEGGREREERRRGEERKEKREREAGIKRRKGRDNFFKPSYFYPIICLSLGKALIQWVCTQRLKNLWQELRGRNLWLRDWAGRLNWSPPRNANSAHHILSFLGDLAKSDSIVEKPILFPKSLQDFAQIQMFRNEAVTSKRLGNNLKLLTPNYSKNFSPCHKQPKLRQSKVEQSPQAHDSDFTSNLDSFLSPHLRNPHFFLSNIQ